MPEDVVWIADHDAREHPGGAQQTADRLIAELRREGLTVLHATARRRRELSARLRRSRALFIVGTVKRLPSSALAQIVARKRFIRFEHDYLFGHQTAAGSVYGRAAANIFLSPLQREEMERTIGWRIPRVRYQLPPFEEAFRRRGARPAPGTVLWLGQVHEIKGVAQVVAYARKRTDLRFTFRGFGSPSDVEGLSRSLARLPNCSFGGPLPHDQAADAYRAHEYFVHLPAWREPFGRTVAEAYLCGCKLIVNDNVGAFSYPWSWEDGPATRRRLLGAAARFAGMIKRFVRAP